MTDVYDMGCSYNPDNDNITWMKSVIIMMSMGKVINCHKLEPVIQYMYMCLSNTHMGYPVYTCIYCMCCSILIIAHVCIL